MALFFDHKLQSKETEANTVCLSWHARTHTLAVASNDGSVHVYAEDGSRVEDVRIKRECAPVCLSWHKTKKNICIGWADGKLVRAHLYSLTLTLARNTCYSVMITTQRMYNFHCESCAIHSHTQSLAHSFTPSLLLKLS